MKRAAAITIPAAFLLLLVNLLLFTGSKEPNEEVRAPGGLRTTNATIAVKIPAAIDFAGEAVPLGDPNVRERLDRELLVNTYWHSSTIHNLKLTARYFPVIEPILAKNGIPDDFKYLAVAESGLQNVVSPSKAAGIWQFLSGTGKEYGLEISEEVDERYHTEKSTQAACDYLKAAYAKFGSWTMAATAYNTGMDELVTQVAVQKPKSYYDLYFENETYRYIFRILAMKEIFSHPEDFGFQLDKEDYYPGFHYTEAVIDTAINDLALFAARAGVSYKTLKVYNPWLRKPWLKNTHSKTYRIRIPH